MVNVTVKALRCPLCGVDLMGLDRDVIFFCPSCANAYRSKGGFKKIEVFRQVPAVDIKTKSLIHLPMWALSIEHNIIKPTDKKTLKRLKMILEDYKFVWVTAFRGWRPSYFGDPGLLYTAGKIQPRFEPATSETMPVGCSVEIAEAYEYPEPFILSIVDRLIDVAEVDIAVNVLDHRLVSMPFLDMGDRILDTQLDWNWPVVFVDDIVSIREITRSV